MAQVRRILRAHYDTGRELEIKFLAQPGNRAHINVCGVAVQDVGKELMPPLVAPEGFQTLQAFIAHATPELTGAFEAALVLVLAVAVSSGVVLIYLGVLMGLPIAWIFALYGLSLGQPSGW